MTPAVSIVVATYNRGNALRWAISSAIAQSFTDWEMIVVGDACTDDTEEVVESFGDERVAFVNLPVNNGDQAVPNNEGVARARGRLIAFLNHDDLWFPDHLSRCVDLLERSPETDGVFSPVAIVALDGSAVLWPSWTGRYEPVRVQAPASGWVMRRATIDRVGPWRHRHDTYDIPSRDWLSRALDAGMRIDQLPYVTALAPHSGARPGSYARRDDEELRLLWSRIDGDPGYREEFLTALALDGWTAHVRPRPAGNAAQSGKDLVVTALGRKWMPIRGFLRYRRKGGLVDELRRVRGL